MFVLLSFHTCVYAVSAQSAILIDGNSGRIIFEKNAYEKRGMASTTKIMTGILALENSDPDKNATVSYKAASTEGSSMWGSRGCRPGASPCISLVWIVSSRNDK